ncbi:MAG: hypothetical protein Q9191_007026 [Dirinaria sp. TL-2023a]
MRLSPFRVGGSGANEKSHQQSFNSTLYTTTQNYGGYGQSNPYAQQGGANPYSSSGAGNPYAQQSGNPYAQQGGAQPSQGGRQQYGGGANGTYAGGNEMEMGAMNGQAGGYGQPAPRDPNAILNECRDIDLGIDNIEKNLKLLKTLQQRAINDPDASQHARTNRELDALNSETMTLYRNFTERLRKIKSQKASGEPTNASQVGKVDRKLKRAIQQYQQAESEYRNNVREQIERQYLIVRPDASRAEIDAAVDDPFNNQVFSQVLLQGNRQGQANSTLQAVRGRHKDIQQIEEQMKELLQLFQDLDQYVVQQEEQVEQIDMQGEQVVVDVNKANTELDTGIKQARSRNRKKWWCLLICVLIIIIVVAVAVGVVEGNRNRS